MHLIELYFATHCPLYRKQIRSSVEDSVISMLLCHCTYDKHGKVREAQVSYNLLGPIRYNHTGPMLWRLTSLSLVWKKLFHPPSTSHPFQIRMIIQPSKTVNPVAEKPGGMGKSSQQNFKNQIHVPVSSSCESSVTKRDSSCSIGEYHVQAFFPWGGANCSDYRIIQKLMFIELPQDKCTLDL